MSVLHTDSGGLSMSIVYALVVAFLLSSPLLAAGDVAAGKQKSAACAACHGADGNSTNPDWPKLAGQNENYIAKQLMDFKEGRRVNALMSGPVAALSKQDMEDLAAYFASQTGTPNSAEATQLELGELIYRGGNMETGVAACMGCHSPAGAGNPAAAFPMLSGQHSKYTSTQLRHFRDNVRANDKASMMRTVARKMTVEEIEAVSQYMAGLHAGSQ
jgi:cytochrome c553